MNTPRFLLLAAAFLAAPAALAQQHGDHGHAPPADAMDHSQMQGMDHARKTVADNLPLVKIASEVGHFFGR